MNYQEKEEDKPKENTNFLESIPLWAVTLIGELFVTVLSFAMILKKVYKLCII